MNTRKWYVWPAVLLFIVIVTAACGNGSLNSSNSATQTKLNKGAAAPMFDLQDLDGNKVALADLAGEKAYVKYWASWCSICLAGLEELNTLAAESTDFRVLSIVSPDFKGEQSEEDFVQWYKGLESDGATVLLDHDGKWAQKFGVRAYPTSYYIGTDGVLAKTAVGHNFNDAIISTFQDIH